MAHLGIFVAGNPARPRPEDTSTPHAAKLKLSTRRRLSNLVQMLIARTKEPNTCCKKNRHNHGVAKVTDEEKRREGTKLGLRPILMSCGIMLGPNKDHLCGGPSSEICAECSVSLCDLHSESCDLCNATICYPCFFRHMAKPHAKLSLPTSANKLERSA